MLSPSSPRALLLLLLLHPRRHCSASPSPCSCHHWRRRHRPSWRRRHSRPHHPSTPHHGPGNAHRPSRWHPHHARTSHWPSHHARTSHRRTHRPSHRSAHWPSHRPACAWNKARRTSRRTAWPSSPSPTGSAWSAKAPSLSPKCCTWKNDGSEKKATRNDEGGRSSNDVEGDGSRTAGQTNLLESLPAFLSPDQLRC